MTKTEAVVRLLKSAIAGSAKVELEHDFSKQWHCYVPAKIEGNLIRFWMRSSLRRVECVVFSDGSGATDVRFREERWLPPRDEFAHWWQLMSGYESVSEKELSEQLTDLLKMRSHRDADADDAEETARSIIHFDLIADASRRVEAFNPLRYLTADEIDDLEWVLTKSSIGKKA